MSKTLVLILLVAYPMVGGQLPSPGELSEVRQRLAPLQHLSFATDREYCGYLAHDPTGARVFTEMVRGGHDGCTPNMPSDDLKLTASLHTHGAYDPEVPAEFPTVLDMESDAREGVDGYVATPGGRLWYIDSHAQVTVQICGLKCLPQDPAFRPGDDGSIAKSYSLDDLRRLEAPG